MQEGGSPVGTRGRERKPGRIATAGMCPSSLSADSHLPPPQAVTSPVGRIKMPVPNQRESATCTSHSDLHELLVHGRAMRE